MVDENDENENDEQRWRYNFSLSFGNAFLQLCRFKGYRHETFSVETEKLQRVVCKQRGVI